MISRFLLFFSSLLFPCGLREGYENSLALNYFTVNVSAGCILYIYILVWGTYVILGIVAGTTEKAHFLLP